MEPMHNLNAIHLKWQKIETNINGMETTFLSIPIFNYLINKYPIIRF